MTVLQFLKLTFNQYAPVLVRPAIICKDGFSVSVQGGTENHYCSPRMRINEYEELELGFPSAKEDLILPYMELRVDDNPLDTVYPCVPLAIVEEVIAKHGGIDIDATVARIP